MGYEPIDCRDYEENLQRADFEKSEMLNAAPETANGVDETVKPVDDAQARSL